MRILNLLLLLPLLLSACSELPLGERDDTIYGYSNAVIVGAIVRDPVTGQWNAPCNCNKPLTVMAFNHVHKPLAETIDEDELPALIHSQAVAIQQRREDIQELREIVESEGPSRVQLPDELPERRPFVGITHGVPR